jgi:cysteine desulfurase
VPVLPASSKPSRRIYLDNNATTRVADAVRDAMLPYLGEEHGNPSSIYGAGRAAHEAVEEARRQVARLLHARPGRILFTGGGSEADNLAIKGAAFASQEKGRHLITTAIEHHAVLHTAKALEKEGFEVSYAPVDEYGMVILPELEKLIRPDTVLVSIMAANNEIGTVQPLEEIGALCKRHNVLFHADCVQAVGHIPIDVRKMNMDFLALSAHKLNGQKGTGVFYKRKGVAIKPVIEGGGQEKNLRSGTENIPGIVGCGEAVMRAVKNMDQEMARVKSLQDGINTILSDFQNNMQEDARNTILVLQNYDGTNLGEFRRNLAQYGVVKVKTVDGAAGDLKTLTVEVNSENYKAILELFKKAIIENGRGFD